MLPSSIPSAAQAGTPGCDPHSFASTPTSSLSASSVGCTSAGCPSVASHPTPSLLFGLTLIAFPQSLASCCSLPAGGTSKTEGSRKEAAVVAQSCRSSGGEGVHTPVPCCGTPPPGAPQDHCRTPSASGPCRGQLSLNLFFPRPAFPSPFCSAGLPALCDPSPVFSTSVRSNYVLSDFLTTAWLAQPPNPVLESAHLYYHHCHPGSKARPPPTCTVRQLGSLRPQPDRSGARQAGKAGSTHWGESPRKNTFWKKMIALYRQPWKTGI